MSARNGVVGWGRLDLGFIAAPAPYQLWLDDHTAGLATGRTLRDTATISQPLAVSDGGQPLRVMLAWTDPPASLSSAKQLVNDLDLVVRGPNERSTGATGPRTATASTTWRASSSQIRPLARYTIEVQAHDVPVDVQPYALVVGGALTSTVPLATATPTATTTSTPTRHHDQHAHPPPRPARPPRHRQHRRQDNRSGRFTHRT